MTNLFDLSEVRIEEIDVADEITLTLRPTSRTAPCPSCGTASQHIQSRYTRTLHDLPSSGHPVHLIVQVRRFFCKKHTCAQKIFAEQLPALCHPHAQRTKRLQEALCQLGLTIGGQTGASVGQEVGISGSRDTILRLVRKSELPVLKEPRIIGLDDWAYKRRLRYGTLICDLERGLPIDLLPDRSVETVSTWLQDHPSIDVVSRDGSSEYASAIQKGAPQARQVSDRWHLTKNLAKCVSVLLAQCLAEIRRAEQVVALLQEEPAEPELRPSETRTVQYAQRTRQAERGERYTQIMTLRKQGLTSAEIAAQVGMAERTVRHWLARGNAPDYKHRGPRAGLINPYKAYLLERWGQGCRNRLQLFRELKTKGYKGSQKGVYRYVATLPSLIPSEKHRSLSSPGPNASLTSPNPLLALSVSQATWLFFRKQADLTEEELENLQQLRQTSSQAETAYQLVERFLQMVREHTGQQLDSWLKDVKASHLEAFDSFVTGVQQDKEAIFAGLTLPWSNGLLEGHVNRLKLIKRSMYGRAKFDLLRLRVLHSPKTRLQYQSHKTEGKQKGPRVKEHEAGETSLKAQQTPSAKREAA
jgi:transposase